MDTRYTRELCFKLGCYLGFLFILSSCGVMYGPPTIESATPYMAKPVYQEDNQSQLYANADLSYTTDANNELYFFRTGVHQGISEPSANFSYGVYTFGGYHTIDRDQISGQSFLGLTGKAGMNFTIKNGRDRWRILGVEAAISQEFGNYRQARKQYSDILLTITESRTYDLALTTEYLFNIDNKEYLAFQFTSGVMPVHATDNHPLYIKAAFILRKRNFNVSLGHLQTIGPQTSPGIGWSFPTYASWQGLQLSLKWAIF